MKPLPLGRASPRRAPSVSRSSVIRFLVTRGSVLVLALALSGCALTLDSTHLGVPVSLAGAAQRPDSGTPFRVTEHARSEEHTSELQSQSNLVCRLLLEKKKI